MTDDARAMFTRGQRVIAGLDDERRRPALVVGFGRDGRTVRVVHDGTKTPVSYWVGFVAPEVSE